MISERQNLVNNREAFRQVLTIPPADFTINHKGIDEESSFRESCREPRMVGSGAGPVNEDHF